MATSDDYGLSEMREEWRDISWSCGRYQVSNLGRVRSLVRPWGRGSRPRNEPAICCQCVSSHGYMLVGLSIPNQRRKNYQVHRLVLEAFIGKCPSGHEAAHLDGNRTNNVLDNLEWKTHRSNLRDRDKHGTTARGERNGRAKLTPNDVEYIRAAVGLRSHRSLARQFGVDASTIGRAARGELWKESPHAQA